MHSGVFQMCVVSFSDSFFKSIFNRLNRGDYSVDLYFLKIFLIITVTVGKTPLNVRIFCCSLKS